MMVIIIFYYIPRCLRYCLEIYIRLTEYRFLAFYFFFSTMLMVYIYISPSSQKEKMKQKKEMNIFHLAHISISIFCRSVLFLVDAASYFLVVRHRLSFFCARDRKFRKKNIKKHERGRDYPFLSLCLSSSHILE
jgi:hypothetical protein